MSSSLLPLFSRVGRMVLDVLYPPHCVVCRGPAPSGEVLCNACQAKAPRIAAPYCEVCSEPFSGKIEGAFICSRCGAHPFAFQCAVSTRRSRDSVRELIHQFKYGGKVPLQKQLGRWLAETLEDPRLQMPRCDRLVPVPLHHARRRERGFNQARLLADELSRASGIPVDDCLKRTRYTATQTAFDRAARMENLRGAFHLRQHRAVTGLHLLLIDDVLTTGSTVDECARVLMAAGAASVRVATVARA
jgi:competence protein ComFC